MLGTNLEPIFGTAICHECNNRFRKIDDAVTKASYLAETSKALKQELNFKSNSHVSNQIDSQLSSRGVRLIHYLVLDSKFPFLCRNRKTQRNNFNFLHIPIPLAPQIIFIYDKSTFKTVAEQWSETELQDKFEITNRGNTQ